MRFAVLAFSAAALAMLAAGCSEPVPQSADGAFWLATTQSDPLACQIAGNIAQVGAVDSTERKTVIVDGTKGTAVSCQVIGTKAPFSVSGTIDDQANSASFLDIDIPSISPGTKIDAPAKGTLTFSAGWTAGNPYSGECNFYFEGKETVASGRIWVSFQCPGLNYGMSTCPLKQGYIILENCLTEDPTAE